MRKKPQRTATIILLCISVMFMLCGCVKVTPQKTVIDELPVYGAEYSIFDPQNIVVNIDGEKYVSAGDVGWSLSGNSDMCGWIDYNGKEYGTVWCTKESENRGIYQMGISLPNTMNITPIYHKKGVDIPNVEAKSVGAIRRCVDEVCNETQDRKLIDSLFYDLNTGNERVRDDEGWIGEDTKTTTPKQAGTFYFICDPYPELLTSFFLFYDEVQERYFVAYYLKKDMHPVIDKVGKEQEKFISDEVAQGLLAL
ncbi:MAG: hypothetical protein RR234_09315 [Christensenella sp.]